MVMRIAFLMIIIPIIRVRITVIVAAAGCMALILILIQILVVDYCNGRSNVAGVNVRAATWRRFENAYVRDQNHVDTLRGRGNGGRDLAIVSMVLLSLMLLVSLMLLLLLLQRCASPG